MSELNDIVAVGLDLKPQTLIRAYSEGVFPWPTPGLPLLWYSPGNRAILSFDRLHVPRRLKSYLRKNTWRYTVNQAFREVIEHCSLRGNEGTWILPEMKAAYTELHHLGHAHSVEVWEGARLIGGLYGVDVAGTFAGESMFHLESHASKAALLFIVSLLRQSGRRFMDIQVMSEHMKAMGAHEISRAQFQAELKNMKDLLKKFGPNLPFQLAQEKSDGFSFEDYCKFIV